VGRQLHYDLDGEELIPVPGPPASAAAGLRIAHIHPICIEAGAAANVNVAVQPPAGDWQPPAFGGCEAVAIGPCGELLARAPVTELVRCLCAHHNKIFKKSTGTRYVTFKRNTVLHWMPLKTGPSGPECHASNQMQQIQGLRWASGQCYNLSSSSSKCRCVYTRTLNPSWGKLEH
jgi:hypothetical protein